jgi:hypothetical protein
MAIPLSHVTQVGLPINVEQVSFPTSLGDPVLRANLQAFARLLTRLVLSEEAVWTGMRYKITLVRDTAWTTYGPLTLLRVSFEHQPDDLIEFE